MKRKYVLCAFGLTLLLLGGCARKQNNAPSYIGAAEARQLALADAGLTAAEVETISADMNTDNGTAYYDVDFAVGGQGYEYSIDAVTGTVIKSRSFNTAQEESRSEAPADMTDTAVWAPPETRTDPPDVPEDGNTGSSASGNANAGTPNPSDNNTGAGASDSANTGTNAASEKISVDTAKEKALNHAGLTAAQVTFVESKTDYDDGRQVYEIEFYTQDYREYDYEIDAYTGEVISYDYELEHHNDNHNSGHSSYHSSTGTGAAGSGAITAEKAKEIALAKVPGATAQNIREFETDYDDGRTEYEGKIIYNNIEYEFEIDASTGAILGWESEPVGH